jgi:hypothetical protein
MSRRILLMIGLTAMPVMAATSQQSAHAATVRFAAVRIDSARAQSLLALADDATMAGKNAEARRLYRELIDEQRAADQFAGKALWRLALNYLYADDVRRAVATLDELAAESNRYGDPSTELKATFESAVLWQQLRRADLVAVKVERARALLQSPAIPDEEKMKVRSRMPAEVLVASR